MKTSIYLDAAILAVSLSLFAGCGTAHKLEVLKDKGLSATLSLPSDRDRRMAKNELFGSGREESFVEADGRRTYVMDAMKDEESGEMVATERLDAAVLIARWRNVAERHGVVDMDFMIVVSDSLQDPRWQLRFDPVVYVAPDTLRLAPLFITGEDFRRYQLRSYERYARYLEGLSRDSTRFVDRFQADWFMSRKTELTRSEVDEHYSRRMLIGINRRRALRKDEYRQKYIKAPIDPAFACLDSVCAGRSPFLYLYSFSVPTRPGLKRIEVSMDGAVYDKGELIHRLPRSENVTFYVSSLSSLADSSVHYKKVITSRIVKEKVSGRLDFAQGSYAVDSTFGDNGANITNLRERMIKVLDNDEFETDSIEVFSSCSPEGSYAVNDRLSRKRAESVKDFFALESGIPKGIAENWLLLDSLVLSDSSLTAAQRNSYLRIAHSTSNPDVRESKLIREPYYRHIVEEHYPSLRFVSFLCHLHRKSQVQDTLVTTVVDTAYMRGVELLKSRNYEDALSILAPYKDFNAALAYMSLDYNATAAEILERLPADAPVLYILAISYSRRGREKDAVRCLLEAVSLEPAYKYRGNLDPEIAAIIRKYNLFED